MASSSTRRLAERTERLLRRFWPNPVSTSYELAGRIRRATSEASARVPQRGPWRNVARPPASAQRPRRRLRGLIGTRERALVPPSELARGADAAGQYGQAASPPGVASLCGRRVRQGQFLGGYVGAFEDERVVLEIGEAPEDPAVLIVLQVKA